MQIHFQSEHPNKLGMITHNALEDEQGFSVDLIGNSFDNLGDMIVFIPPRIGGLGSGWKRRIWISHRISCSRFPGEN